MDTASGLNVYPIRAKILARTSASSAVETAPLRVVLRLAPVETFDLVSQDDAVRCAVDQHFERIIFDLHRHGTADHQAGFVVIRGRAQNESRPEPRLFMTGLRCEIKPYDIPGVRNVAARHLPDLFAHWGAVITPEEVFPLVGTPGSVRGLVPRTYKRSNFSQENLLP
jgi:hypothetical protein